MKSNVAVVVAMFAIMLSVSCNSFSKKASIQDTVMMMQANRLKLGLENMVCRIPDNDTARVDTAKAPLRLVVYVDSTHCSPCVLNKMYQWNELIDKTRAEGNHVSYIFIFEPKADQIEDAYLSTESSGLKNRIYLDTAHVFKRDNKFVPADSKYHSMLINASDSIVLVGNPKTNKSIEKIFFNMINGCH